MKTIKCKYKNCDKEFNRTSNGQKYCSKKCLKMATRLKKGKIVIEYEKECASRTCENKFKTFNKNRIYCCIQCAKREVRKKQEDKGIKYSPPQITKVCEFRACNEKFTTTNKKKIFCCNEHAKAEAHYRRADAKNPNRRKSHKTYAATVKADRFPIPNFSAKWLQDAWDERKAREAS